MRTGGLAHVTAIGLSVALIGPTVGAASAVPAEQLDLDIGLITYALDLDKVDTARQTAEMVLATAGLRVHWRVPGGDGCGEPRDRNRCVLVHLLPFVKRLTPTTSGEVARDPVTRVPTVLVYVPRNDDVTWAIRHSSGGRSAPELSTVTTGHVLGLTIAHEIGHVLGLRHRESGPMKAEIGRDDLIALRRAKFRFRAGEVATMRQVLVTGVVPATARVR